MSDSLPSDKDTSKEITEESAPRVMCGSNTPIYFLASKRAEAEVIQQEIVELRKQNKKLEKEIRRLKFDQWQKRS